MLGKRKEDKKKKEKKRKKGGVRRGVDLAVSFETGGEDWGELVEMLHAANKGRKPSAETGKSAHRRV